MYDVEQESGNESEISMREARRRIHSLLDDTFSTLKRYQKQIGQNEAAENNKTSTPYHPSRENSSRRYAGMPPSLPEQPPAHGRTSVTPSAGNNKRAPTMQPPNPYMMLQYPQYPAYTDPLLTWDPMDRQRYLFLVVLYISYRYRDSYF